MLILADFKHLNEREKERDANMQTVLNKLAASPGCSHFTSRTAHLEGQEYLFQ